MFISGHVDGGGAHNNNNSSYREIGKVWAKRKRLSESSALESKAVKSTHLLFQLRPAMLDTLVDVYCNDKCLETMC